jgi:fructose-1,6-bisphosphatase/inositol monophosphatase family enzyme
MPRDVKATSAANAAFSGNQERMGRYRPCLLHPRDRSARLRRQRSAQLALWGAACGIADSRWRVGTARAYVWPEQRPPRMAEEI